MTFYSNNLLKVKSFVSGCIYLIAGITIIFVLNSGSLKIQFLIGRKIYQRRYLYIGKIIVHPDYQGKGYEGQLFRAIEQMYPQLRYELFTSDKSINNLGIYEHLGYVSFKEEEIMPGLKLVFLEKYSGK